MSIWHRWTAATGEVTQCTQEQLSAVEEVFHDHGAYLKRGETIIERVNDSVWARGRGDFKVSGGLTAALLQFAADLRRAAGFDVAVHMGARPTDYESADAARVDAEVGEPLFDESTENDPPLQESPEPCVMYTVTVTDVPSPQTAAQITVVLHAAGLPDTALTDGASTVCGWGYRAEIPGPEWRDELRKKITDVVPPGRAVGIAFRVDVP
jgi:hypothetical protein